MRARNWSEWRPPPVPVSVDLDLESPSQRRPGAPLNHAGAHASLGEQD